MHRRLGRGVIGNGGQAGQALARGLIDCVVTVDGLPGPGGVMAEHVMMAQRSLIRLPPLSVAGDHPGQVREHWTLRPTMPTPTARCGATWRACPTASG
ncbi:hypothetical protein [Ralstonia pickettii]|uniref:hypothetical protein n=1 Tax=Cupriavidus sp. DF5525 TaxID=3160989 RepID=UPI0003B0717F|nr:hypothetical protein N234_00480 [Ralstonia pickettii DTP0602]